MLKLKWPRTISPFWYGRGEKTHIGTVSENGTVNAESDVLEILEGDCPPLGTRLVIVKHDEFLTAETEEEHAARMDAEQAARQKEARDRQLAAQQRAFDFRAQRQRSAEAANSLLRIPVRWTSGLKSVLSGLSRNSNGSGENRRSVTHILLLEPLEEHGLSRHANTFLCTTGGGSNGRAWTGKLHTSDSGNDGEYVSEVTCKQCLKLAKRWASNASGVPPELIK